MENFNKTLGFIIITLFYIRRLMIIRHQNLLDGNNHFFFDFLFKDSNRLFIIRKYRYKNKEFKEKMDLLLKIILFLFSTLMIANLVQLYYEKQNHL